MMAAKLDYHWHLRKVMGIAGLVSDRSAQRPTRRRTSTALILVRNGAC